MSTHHHVKPQEWSSAGGKVKGRSASAIETNMALDEIKRRVYDIRDQILREVRNFRLSH